MGVRLSLAPFASEQSRFVSVLTGSCTPHDVVSGRLAIQDGSRWTLRPGRRASLTARCKSACGLNLLRRSSVTASRPLAPPSLHLEVLGYFFNAQLSGQAMGSPKPCPQQARRSCRCGSI